MSWPLRPARCRRESGKHRHIHWLRVVEPLRSRLRLHLPPASFPSLSISIFLSIPLFIVLCWLLNAAFFPSFSCRSTQNCEYCNIGCVEHSTQRINVTYKLHTYNIRVKNYSSKKKVQEVFMRCDSLKTPSDICVLIKGIYFSNSNGPTRRDHMGEKSGK